MTDRRLPASLLAALLLLGVAALPRVARADDPATPPPDAPSAKKPAVEVEGPDAKTRAEVIKILDDLREEASKIRGLAWKKKVEADVLTRPQLMKRLEEMIKDDFDPKEYDRDLKTMRRLGLLTAEEDPIDLSEKFLALGIAGYYDPKTKKLYLIDGLTGDAQRPTILHELTHALEDQYIDLEKTQDAIKKDQDKTFAFKCSIEGSAETARALYEKEHPEYARLSQQEQMKSANQAELSKVLKETPAMLVVGTLLHYQIGPAFVGRWIRATGKGGETLAEYPAAMERLYADLPTTEEEVMHPGKFVGEHRDLPRTVVWPKDLATAAGEGYEALDLQEFGELDFALWIDRWLGGNAGRFDQMAATTGRYYGDEAKAAAEGWDGTWLQLFVRRGDPRAYAFGSAWDSPKDAVEAGNALLACARKQYGGKFKSGEWVEKDGVRTSNFEDSYGLGRIEVKGDEVRLVDGLSLAALDRVFAALETARFEKDANDTWTPENAPDVTAGADWRDATGVAWKKPTPEWTVVDAGDTATMKKDALEVKVRVYAKGLMAMVPIAFGGLSLRYPDFDVKNPPLTEASVASKESARIEFDSTVKGAEPGAAKRHVVAILVPLGDTRTLVIQATSDDTAWAAISKDFEAAVAGFVVKD